MRRGPKVESITLTTEESNRLLEWTRRHKTSQALALRARIVLACQQGRFDGEVARELRVTRGTVGKWRRRFQSARLEGLLDEPRPGAPRTISDTLVEQVIAKTLHEKPRAATQWSSRAMAKSSGLSQSAVVRIWRAFGLQPHRAETFKLSTDPLFIEKVRDIVGLYLNPPDRALVLCVDEKSQALDRTQPILPMMPGVPERGAPTTTAATGLRRCLRPSTLRPAKSSVSCIGATARRSFCSFCAGLTRQCRRNLRCIW